MDIKDGVLEYVEKEDLELLKSNPDKFWEGVTKIGEDAFYGYSSLTSITIPDSVTEIEKSAFWGCSSLTSITIPNSVISIGDWVFCYCESLTEIIIPNSVTKIGKNAFNHCSSLTSIIIPNSVTKIEDFAFESCSSLTSITIPEGVTGIGRHAFDGCSSLTSITIPEGVTGIGRHAFEGCSSLTSITIPEGVTAIGEGAFKGCSSLTSITIPEGVTGIGEGAFKGCSSLTSITIPEGVTWIGMQAFEGCSSLTSITIPNSVTKIGKNVFNHCSSLTSIIIPNSVTEIGESAFNSCSSLTSIIIPNSVTEIGESAFNSCSSLTSITIPEGVTWIGMHAFDGCSSLTSITIPEGVTWIGRHAFEDCSSLEEFNVEPGNTNYKTTPDKRCLLDSDNKLIGFAPAGLTSYSIPAGVTAIGEGAFKDCSSLTSITIPEGVTDIGTAAFRDCSSLTSITIPEGVTDIGGSAFEGCTNLCLIFKNFENVKHPIHALLNANFKYAYINKSGEVVFSHQKEPNYENYLKIALTETSEMTIKKDNDYFQVGLSDVANKNFIKNLMQATEWQKQGEVKFIPPNYTLSVFPPDQFDKYYLNKNNKRWADLVKATGLGTLNGQEKYNSLVDLMKIYYALGGFSEKQGEREEAFKYVENHVARCHDKEKSPQDIGEEIHRRFSGLVLKGAYNPDFAKFFMRYYHENPDFMMFNIDDHEQDYLCKAHNNFALIQSIFPNKVVTGNTKRDLLSPEFVAEHCDIVKYNNIDKGNEALAMLVGRYGYSQDQFDEMQGIYNVAKGLKDKYVIQADRAKAENGISFRVLEKDDPLGFVLGDITNCCQRIGEAGGSCVDDGYRNPNAGFLVFEEEIKDENGQPTGEYQILAQAYIWYDPENKTVCYDNIEIPTKILKALREGKQLSTEGLMKSLTESADAIMSAMNRNGVEVKKVTTGQGYNDLREELEKEYGAPERSQIAQHRDYFGYSDAKGAQYMIRTYDQTTKLYASSIKNEIEKAGEDIKTIGLSLAQKE